jgi:membrane-associated phospholipid phosphatase
MDYGFVPDHSIGGQVAGFVHFDKMTGLGVFKMLYEKNANVFAAIPSLHSAYVPVALYYALKTKPSKFWLFLLTFVSLGIWFSAVYSGHHYIIDVLLGVMCTIIGLCVFELLIMRLPFVKRAYSSVARYLD